MDQELKQYLEAMESRMDNRMESMESRLKEHVETRVEKAKRICSARSTGGQGRWRFVSAVCPGWRQGLMSDWLAEERISELERKKAS